MTTATPIKDCREFLQEHGPDALRQSLESAEPFEVEEPPAGAAGIQERDDDDDLADRFFYDGQRYYLDTGAEFVPMDCRSVERHLLLSGGCDRPLCQLTICRIQTERFINFAGPLAGLPRGLHESGGSKLLATVSPRIIEAKPGQWDTLRAVIEGLIGNDDVAGDEQVTIFLGWLKYARESLVSGRRRPGQALALAGPRGSGKTLLVDILEAALGGRRANPYPHFTGRTNFNADIAGAELLAVDDEAGSTDIRARKNLAANIKANLFSGAVRIEGKFKTAFTFRPVWRMVLALNDEPESLLVLPPITEEIGDKITLLRCHRRPLPMPAHSLDERDRFFNTLTGELPALLDWLERWSVPEELQEERCGIRYFHHPVIVASLLELSPEGQLKSLIATAATNGWLEVPWEGTAAELKAVLTGCDGIARDAEKLLGHWIAATGAYLSRLEGDGVEKLPMRDGITRWRIHPSGQVG